jgi:hypothetical protein
MRRGTTPTNTFAVDVDLTGATIFVSYEQDGKMVFEKTGTDVTVATDSVSVNLTQADTLAFHPGRVCIQIRYIDQMGTADASNIIETTAERIIKDGVISYV